MQMFRTAEFDSINNRVVYSNDFRLNDKELDVVRTALRMVHSLVPLDQQEIVGEILKTML